MNEREVNAPMAWLDGVLCLDFEASGLGRSSYPIEVAIVDCSTRTSSSWLIRPTEDWLRNGVWMHASEAVHQIKLSDLLAFGSPVAQVVRELCDRCRGNQVLCDGGESDWLWMARLYASVDQAPPFRLSDFGEFARELAVRTGQDPKAVAAAELEALARFPARHRAGVDAQRLAETLRFIAGYP